MEFDPERPAGWPLHGPDQQLANTIDMALQEAADFLESDRGEFIYAPKPSTVLRQVIPF